MTSFKKFFLESESGKYSRKPDWDAIKKFFGTVSDIEDAYYILPDGSLLRIDGMYGDEYGAEHNDISVYDGPGERFRSTEDFLRAGAIRVRMDDNPVVDFRVKPTPEQMDRIYDFVENVDGNPNVEGITVSWDRKGYEAVPVEEKDRVVAIVRRKTGATLEEERTAARKISEEKVFAKEDDGGAPAGGAASGADGGSVVSPPSTPGSSSEVVPPPDNPGLDTQDVFGKCDHEKDGFFGPGCFHLPYNIFSVPSYRRKKPKKRHLKTLNLAEDDDYADFERYAKTRIAADLDEIGKKILGRIDPEMRVEYEEDYPFEDEKAEWVASVDFDGRDDAKVFPIGVNVPAIYRFLYDEGMEMDNLETDLQIRAALLHETAHAIIRYLEESEIYDPELSPAQEEKVCEEFARYHLRRYTGQATSRLEDIVGKVFSEEERDA